MHKPEFQPRWDLVLQAAGLQQLSRHVDEALKVTMTASALATAYADGEQPWCRLDTLHRHFEKKASSVEFLLSEQLTEIEQMVIATRNRYAETSGRLAETFVRALVISDFEVPGRYRQVQTFERAVAPGVGAKRVAYLMVDALRYDLAFELVDLLSNDFDSELEAVTGTMPVSPTLVWQLFSPMPRMRSLFALERRKPSRCSSVIPCFEIVRIGSRISRSMPVYRSFP
jgi:hypothetical protein